MDKHIITLSEQHEHLPLLRQYFGLRKRLFIDGLRWEGPAVTFGWETDQWDTPAFDPVYVLVSNRNGQLLGGSRFIRATVPTMFETLWPERLYEPLEKTDTILEIHRWAIDPDIDRLDHQLVTLSLSYAICDWAIDNGAKTSLMLGHKRLFDKSRHLKHLRAAGPVNDDFTIAMFGDLTPEINKVRAFKIADLENQKSQFQSQVA